jgi:hypothetical protein
VPSNFGRKEGLDPQDFIFKGKGAAEVLIKSSNQINGQQFLIEECQGSHIFLLDHIGSLTVDYCVDCSIVTGPISSRSTPLLSSRLSVSLCSLSLLFSQCLYQELSELCGGRRLSAIETQRLLQSQFDLSLLSSLFSLPSSLSPPRLFAL